jgi:hypothetical protein
MYNVAYSHVSPIRVGVRVPEGGGVHASEAEEIGFLPLLLSVREICAVGEVPARILVVGFQVEKVTAVSQSKSNNVWI